MKKSFVKNNWSEDAEKEKQRRLIRKGEMVAEIAGGKKKAVQKNDKRIPEKKPSIQTQRTQNGIFTPTPVIKQGKKKPQTKAIPSKVSFMGDSFARIKDITYRPDVIIFQISMILLAFGLVMVFSSSSYEGLISEKGGFFFIKRQFIYAVLGVIAMFMMMFINTEFVRKIAAPTLAVFVLMIIYATLFSKAEYGAQRWLSFGPIKFMPSDFAKPLMVVVFSDFLLKFKSSLNSLYIYMLVLIAVFAVPALIAVEDLGTAITFFGVLFAMVIVAGAPVRYLATTLGLGIGAFAIAAIWKPYRIARLTGFLHPFAAGNSDAGSFQLVQSLYAFGDGGIFGVGLGNGGQKMSHLFAAHTDFIYAVIGEELGLVGALCVLALFVAFGWRGYWIAMHIRDEYKSFIVLGLTSFLVFQAIINMSVAVGVMPVTGITLPLISYGGTSLIVSLSMVGYILNLSRYVEKVGKRK